MKTGGPGSAPARQDLIVVGSGVAGLRAAIEAAEGGLRVALLAKDTATDSSTDVAQGGVAVALSDEDQVGLHYSDTLAAGDGLCDEAAVRALVGEGPGCIGQLIEWGAQFDREGARLAFTREGAHSARRILHARGDSTGREILRTLWRKASSLDGILFLPHTFSVDLILRDGESRGLVALDETSGRRAALEADAVLLATGGAGQVFRETTNPPQATGDGIAIAWRAGASLRDMEFVQFHPTSLHIKGAPRFLLSEALRGEGGILRSTDGRRFMLGVDPRAELAPRDVVARAIAADMARTGADHVLLDMTHLDAAYLRRRFPRIHATCLSHGADLAATPIPVAPAAHYMMGGVLTDLWGRTTVGGVYAAGEVACTGVHGANRLASNSLLEGLVFGARAGQAIVAAAGRPRRGGPAAITDRTRSAGALAGDGAALERIRSIAWSSLGIVREAGGLRRAVDRLAEELRALGPDGATRRRLEAANIATVACAIARCALAREESRGAHHRSDFPARDDERFARSSVLHHLMESPALLPARARTAP